MFIRLALGLLLACACAMPGWARDPVAPAAPPSLPEDVQDEAIFIIEEGAPPGFENLDVPQKTFIDIHFGGRSLSPAPAIFTSTSVRLLDPGAVVREISGLLFPDRIVRALTGTLETNADRSCVEPGVPDGCGLLEPEEAGVIFDKDRFRMEIFVARSMLQLARINSRQRIPPPRDDWSGLATLGGSVSGTSNTEARYSFRADTLLARGPTHLNFVSDLQTGGRYVVDRLALNHDWQDWQLVGGLFRSRPFRVLGENEIVGIRAESSLRTRTRLYLDRAYGSRLPVFLRRRSLVQIFRDGRLLGSGVYDVGNQELDTSELPSGAYEVEIRIQDPVSGEQRDTQFFAKTDDLPPLGEIHFNAEAGFIRERIDRDKPLQVARAGLVRFSTAMRVGKQFGFDTDFALIDEETVFTVGGLWLGPNVIVRSGPTVTSRGAAGVEFFGAYEHGPFFANVNLRGFWGETGSRFLRIPSTDFLVTTAYNWRRIQIGARGNVHDRSMAKDPRFSITPWLHIPLFRRARLRGDLRIEYTHSDQGNLVLVKVDLVEWIRQFQFSQSVSGRYEDTTGGPEGVAEADLRARWRSPRTFPADVQTDLRVSRRRDRTSVAASGDVRSHRGAVNAFVDQSFHDDLGAETFYGAQFSVGIVGDRDGLDALGENAGLSAILIEISGDYESGLFDVFVNDSRRASARVGQPLLVPLPPYAQYEVRLSSIKGQAIDYDSKPRDVTLYPGSTARLRWEVRRIFVLIAEVIRPDGSLVNFGRVQGAVGEADTDENGFLQADVVPGARLRVHTREPDTVCEILVPENLDREDFLILDKIECGVPSERSSEGGLEEQGRKASAATVLSTP